MTAETKAIIQTWISQNLMSDDPHAAIHSVDSDGLGVEADGHLSIGELAELIESVERERCATEAYTTGKIDFGNGSCIELPKSGIFARHIDEAVERCAKIAEAMPFPMGHSLRREGHEVACAIIATEIRKDRGCDPPQVETNLNSTEENTIAER